jgi:GxxExxY protein
MNWPRVGLPWNVKRRYVKYKGVTVDCGYRLDLCAEDKVILELKAVEKLEPIHEAQVLSYLKLSGSKVGLLINFNVKVLKSRVRRFVLGLEE